MIRHRRLIREFNTKYDSLVDQMDVLCGMCYDNGGLTRAQQNQLRELIDEISIYGDRAERWISVAKDCLKVSRGHKPYLTKESFESRKEEGEVKVITEATDDDEEEEKLPELELNTNAIVKEMDYHNCLSISRDIEDIIIGALENYMEKKNGIIPEDAIKEYLKSDWLQLVAAIYERGTGEEPEEEEEEETDSEE